MTFRSAHDVLRFSYPYIFADDVKLLSINRGHDQIQADLVAISNWVTENKMVLAMDKCTTMSFGASKQNFYLQNKVLNSSDVVKDLGIHIHESLSSEKYLEHRFKKAHSLKKHIVKKARNVSPKIATSVKLGLYKSVILQY